MKATLDDPIRELKAVLADHLPWHGARIGFLAQFLLALFKVRSVNLAELATGFGGTAQVDSHYQRLQRFFRSFEIDPDSWARLLVRLVPVGTGPWRLTLDRTHWKFGAVDINFRVLGIADRGLALPVFWSVLGKAGNSNTAERVALMERFLAVFGVERIAVLLTDREFVGAAWFRWLQARRIPFHQRLTCDTLVPNRWNRIPRVDVLLESLKPGQTHPLPGRRPVWGGFVHLSAPRLEDGELLIIATSGAPPREAIDAYADRWPVETTFQHLAQDLNSEIKMLGYPRAALFGFCIGLVAYNMLAVLKAALRQVHGAAVIDTQLSGYYVADEVGGTYRGMMIAIPPPEWRVFRQMTVPAFADLLLDLARKIPLAKFRKHPRGPKTPRPPRPFDPKHPHQATAKLLAERRA